MKRNAKKKGKTNVTAAAPSLPSLCLADTLCTPSGVCEAPVFCLDPTEAIDWTAKNVAVEEYRGYFLANETYTFDCLDGLTLEGYVSFFFFYTFSTTERFPQDCSDPFYLSESSYRLQCQAPGQLEGQPPLAQGLAQEYHWRTTGHWDRGIEHCK